MPVLMSVFFVQLTSVKKTKIKIFIQREKPYMVPLTIYFYGLTKQNAIYPCSNKS